MPIRRVEYTGGVMNQLQYFEEIGRVLPIIEEGKPSRPTLFLKRRLDSKQR
jgi:hypothetical protein